MLYEDKKDLKKETLDLHRAIDSLKEELEAIDLYQQRADACTDENLRKVLVHNMNEEKEHAAMLIEWIRQHDKKFAKETQDYFNSKDVDLTKKHE